MGNLISDFEWCSIAAFHAESDSYAPLYREALEHAGIPFKRIPALNQQELEGIHVLLLCGEGTLSEAQRESVESWMSSGGRLVCSGSAWGLQSLFKLDGTGIRLSREALRLSGEDRLWPGGPDPIAFIGGTGYSGDSQAAVSAGNYQALTRKTVGRGCALFLAPHLGQTLALMTYGASVETDKFGPTDPSAVLNDGKLRSEDGTVLDLSTDRETAPGAPCPAFLQPHADRLREMWIRAVVEAAEQTGAVLPILWMWPDGAPAVGTLSVDADTFETDQLDRVHRAMTMIGCRPAWMIGTPGFPLDVYRTLRAWEHEIGLLFQSDAHQPWNEEKIKVQQVSLARIAAIPTCTSVRPSDGQWQGWTSFYEIAERVGARVSISKGGRQPGTSGFLFGTGHPFFPYKRDGHPHLIMELPYTVFMPGVVTPDAVAEAILTQTLASHGAFHIALHPKLGKLDASLNSARRLMATGRQSRMAFLRPDEVYAFERGRRAMKVFKRGGQESGSLALSHDQPMEGLTIHLIGPRLEATIRGKVTAPQAVERYGTRVSQLIVNLEARTQLDILLAPDAEARAA